jgi:hypothetical protein
MRSGWQDDLFGKYNIPAYCSLWSAYFYPMRNFIVGVILVLLSVHQAFGQYSVGTWRDHLPYGNVVDVCFDHERTVYGATPYGVFTYEPTTGEVERWNKINRLSDVDITSMEFNDPIDAVIVGYRNGNVDFLFRDKTINLPDIKLSNLIGDKAVYDVFSYGDFIYLSCGFGVVVIDPFALEVKSTYFLGNNGQQDKINDVFVMNNEIYVVGSEGVKKANVNDPFLANFQNWTAVTDWQGVGRVIDAEYFQDNLFVHYETDTNDVIWRYDLTSGSWSVFAEFQTMRYKRLWSNENYLCIPGEWAIQVYDALLYEAINTSSLDGGGLSPNMVVRDKNNTLWVADKNRGLVAKKANGEEFSVKPEGPASAEVRRMTAYNDHLWVAHGGLYPYGGNFWRQGVVSGRVGESWSEKSFTGVNQTPGVSDVVAVAIDPLDNAHVNFGSWEEGLIDYKSNGSVSIFNAETNNSTLEGSGFAWAPGWTGVGGMAYDDQGILWFTNSYANKPLQALDRAGNFYAFGFNSFLTNDDWLTDVVASREGYLFAIVSGRGILAFDDNGTVSNTSDDNYKLLSEADGSGGLASKDVLCMIEDLDGELWVGTVQGLSIFYSQSSLFSDDPLDAEPILITQDGNVQELLGTESITAIEIDGGNRKWVGTKSSGVFLFSADGLQQLAHYTAENSPLLSNSISDIAVNQANGEVYIATESGMLSYFSTATNFDQAMENVRVFPNPVEPSYDGNITVDGLAYNSTIRITDTAGNVVYQGNSEGGRAFWNGKDADGIRPATGVYYVFCSNPDGKKTEVLQFTFIH